MAWFEVYGDYGYQNEELLRQFDNLEDACQYVDHKFDHNDMMGFDRIEVVSFASDGEVISHYEVNAEDLESESDDYMDGDHDSAMASAGWGTDEDYGYYGDE